jgi:hypothetical protein
MSEHFEKWGQYAVLGLILLGGGLALTLHAAEAKADKQGFWAWFIKGTLGLSLFNSGVALFGEAVKHRALYDAEHERLIRAYQAPTD